VTRDRLVIEVGARPGGRAGSAGEAHQHHEYQSHPIGVVLTLGFPSDELSPSRAGAHFHHGARNSSRRSFSARASSVFAVGQTSRSQGVVSRRRMSSASRGHGSRNGSMGGIVSKTAYTWPWSTVAVHSSAPPLDFLALEPREPELHLLHNCFDTWRGVGNV